MTAPAAAATIGRPGGTSGVSASAISAAEQGGDAGARGVELADEEGEEERGEHRVEPVVGRVAERAAAEHAQRPCRRTTRPSARAPAPTSRSRSTRPVALGDRPRLVDRELRLEQAPQPAARAAPARPTCRSPGSARLSSTAAAIAAATAPPDPSTDATANCAEPANVVSDITIGATVPIPASRARMPNDAPKARTATASGAAARMPATTATRAAVADTDSVRHNGTRFHDDGVFHRNGLFVQ